MEPFIVLVIEGSPYLPEKKNPGGNAGIGDSTTCHFPRHGMRKVVPPRFLPSFLILCFQEIWFICFQMCPSLLSR
jgi:hypothetical protein